MNPLAKPKLKKIILNMGLKEALADKKVLDSVSEQLKQITGQKPMTTYARKAIAAFKLRKGEPIGLKVTLRSKRMGDFLQKLVAIVLPRVRDFKGIPESGFDGKGNYTLGINEIIIFPEIDYAKIDKIRGLEVTLVTTAKDNKEARNLLEDLGMPFVKASGKERKESKNG